MKMQNQFLTIAALTGFVAGAALLSTSAVAKDGFEKCEGVVKASKNNCAANGHSCAAQAKTDNASGEWIYVPTGTCDKIVGGKVVAPKS